MNRKMTRPVTLEELPELQRKRAEAIKAAGTKWLLHPANHVKRKTASKRPLLVLLAFVVALGIANTDCDGKCAQTTEVQP